MNIGTHHASAAIKHENVMNAIHSISFEQVSVVIVLKLHFSLPILLDLLSILFCKLGLHLHAIKLSLLLIRLLLLKLIL